MQSLETIAQTLQGSQSSLQMLANKDRIETHATEFVSSHADVLVVTSDSNQTSGILWLWFSQNHGAFDDSPWFCDATYEFQNPGTNGSHICDSKKMAKAATWRLLVWGYRVLPESANGRALQGSIQ